MSPPVLIYVFKEKKEQVNEHRINIYCSPCWGWSLWHRWDWAGPPGRVGLATGLEPSFQRPVCECSRTGWCFPRPADNAPAGKNKTAVAWHIWTSAERGGAEQGIRHAGHSNFKQVCFQHWFTQKFISARPFLDEQCVYKTMQQLFSLLLCTNKGRAFNIGTLQTRKQNCDISCITGTS